jgi:predicted XRE-type DNA-binding protein
MAVSVHSRQEFAEMIANATPSDPQIRTEFEELLPELQSRFRHRFLGRGPDWAAECTAEGIAQSWQTFRSARQRGKWLNAACLAWAAIRAVLSGRLIAGCSSRDALWQTRLARQRKGVHVSLHDLPDGTAFHRVWADRRWRWPILEYVAVSMDWTSFRKALCDRDKILLDLKLARVQQKDIAQVLGVTRARICQRLAELRGEWTDFQGDAPASARAARADDTQLPDHANAVA